MSNGASIMPNDASYAASGRAVLITRKSFGLHHPCRCTLPPGAARSPLGYETSVHPMLLYVALFAAPGQQRELLFGSFPHGQGSSCTSDSYMTTVRKSAYATPYEICPAESFYWGERRVKPARASPSTPTRKPLRTPRLPPPPACPNPPPSSTYGVPPIPSQSMTQPSSAATRAAWARTGCCRARRTALRAWLR